MTGWNMPPGCNESDIPGNRPEDQAYEALCDKIANAVCKALNVEELIDVRVTQDQWDAFIEGMAEVCSSVYEEGYRQGSDDEKLCLGQEIHELQLRLAKHDTMLGKEFVENLTEYELGVICWVINHSGSHDHPWADKQTLPYFVRDYVITCLRDCLDTSDSSSFSTSVTNMIVRLVR